MTACQGGPGSSRVLTTDKPLSPLPCLGRVLPGVIAITALSTAFPAKQTRLLGMQFDCVGTSKCCFCHLTCSEAASSCSAPPFCFPQHHLSPGLCPSLLCCTSATVAKGDTARKAWDNFGQLCPPGEQCASLLGSTLQLHSFASQNKRQLLLPVLQVVIQPLPCQGLPGDQHLHPARETGAPSTQLCSQKWPRSLGL